MTNLNDLKEYWESMLQKQPGLKSVFFITEEGDVKDFISDISPEQQPFALVLVPSGNSQGSEQDNFREQTRHLFYILEKENSFRKTSLDIQVETQPLTEAIKMQLLADKSPCNLLRYLDEGSFHTDPERKKFSSCTGWSVSFNS
ncbi:MAG TPA: hypothetical protein VK152_06665 [Paludibacter sp.]|nr:hypothetical protein [Paludibacter sp.]